MKNAESAIARATEIKTRLETARSRCELASRNADVIRSNWLQLQYARLSGQISLLARACNDVEDSRANESALDGIEYCAALTADWVEQKLGSYADAAPAQLERDAETLQRAVYGHTDAEGIE